jgi:hypothetical protein
MKYALKVAKNKMKEHTDTVVQTTLPTEISAYLTANPPTAVADWNTISNKPEVFPPGTHGHLGYEPANENIQGHVLSSHAPAGAQKNSDITKEEIESKLIGEISSHSHAGGGGGLSQAQILARGFLKC